MWVENLRSVRWEVVDIFGDDGAAFAASGLV